MSDDKLRVPGPPSDLSDAEQEAWKRGAATYAGMIGRWLTLLSELIDEDVDDAVEDTDDEYCSDCGTKLVTGFGAPICPNCKKRG